MDGNSKFKGLWVLAADPRMVWLATCDDQARGVVAHDWELTDDNVHFYIWVDGGGECGRNW